MVIVSESAWHEELLSVNFSSCLTLRPEKNLHELAMFLLEVVKATN